MAKIQTKKININDFSESSRPDMTKLARSLNPFYDDIERAFRKGFTIEENLPMQYQSITVTVDAGGIPTQRAVLNTSLTSVRGCVIVKAVSIDSFVTSAPFITFDQNNTTLEIKHVAGLPANKSFTLTLLLVN
ncbi:MAG: hypothetical protein ACOYOV_00025 [Bacteroidales bacterium]